MNARQGKDTHNLSINSLAPFHLPGNPPHSPCFKLPVLCHGNLGDQGAQTLLPSCWFSMMAPSARSRPLKMGTCTLCCQYPLTRTQHACKARKTRVTECQRAQHPILGVPSAFEDQALGYSLREEMNRPFSLPSLETLAALLKHKHNRV